MNASAALRIAISSQGIPVSGFRAYYTKRHN